MKLKRSEAKANLLREMRIVGIEALTDELAERALAVIEHMGETWEPEAPEWPELKVRGDGALAADCAWPIPLGLPRRIARAWNARRPGGEMERRLRVLAARQNELNSGVRDEIQAALRLGVEGE